MEMTTEQKYYYFLGYARRHAEELKEEGMFKDITIDQLVIKLIEGAVKNV